MSDHLWFLPPELAASLDRFERVIEGAAQVVAEMRDRALGAGVEDLFSGTLESLDDLQQALDELNPNILNLLRREDGTFEHPATHEADPEFMARCQRRLAKERTGLKPVE